MGILILTIHILIKLILQLFSAVVISIIPVFVFLHNHAHTCSKQIINLMFGIIIAFQLLVFAAFTL